MIAYQIIKKSAAELIFYGFYVFRRSFAGKFFKKVIE